MAIKIETHRVTSTEVCITEEGRVLESGDTAFILDGGKVFSSVRAAEAYHANRTDSRSTLSSTIQPA